MVIIELIGRFNRGGTANWLNILVPELRELGNEVHLFAGYTPENEQEDLSFSQLRGTHIKFNGKQLNLVRDFVAIFRFRKILKEIQPDVLNTHTAKAGMIGRIAAIGLPVKLCHTYHGHVLTGYYNSYLVKIYIFIEKLLARRTDTIIAVGNKVKEELLEFGIGESNQYRVVEPGIPELKYLSKSAAKSKYHYEKNDFVIGWLGRLTPIKQPEIIINLSYIFSELNFLVGGDGELASIFTEKMPSNIKFVGWQNPEDFWPACNLALLTSRNEGIPTSLIEAAMFGLPIVAMDVGSVEEVVINEKNGFLVQDSLQIQKAIKIIYENKLLYSEMSKKSIEVSKLKFSKSTFISSHMSVYQKLQSH